MVIYYLIKINPNNPMMDAIIVICRFGIQSSGGGGSFELEYLGS
jgi:hypothetical protein